MEATAQFSLAQPYTHCALEFSSVELTQEPTPTLYLKFGDIDIPQALRRAEGYTHCILDYSYESGLSDMAAAEVAYGLEVMGIDRKRQFWITNCTTPSRPINTHGVSIDYFLLQAWHYSRGFEPTPMHTRQRRGMCLTGKLDERLERTHCLGTLWQQGMWPKMTISTLADQQPVNTGYGVEFERACVTATVNTVPRYLSTSPGWPAPQELYQTHHSSLVLETFNRRGKPFITEKTYRTIAHGHPFVIYGQPGTTDYLESRGFDTFRSITGKYDLQETVADHRAVVDSYIRLLDGSDSVLQQGIEQNLMRLEQLAVTEKLKLDAALEKFYAY